MDHKDCLSLIDLRDLSLGNLSDDAADAILDHLEECCECTLKLESIESTPTQCDPDQQFNELNFAFEDGCKAFVTALGATIPQRSKKVERPRQIEWVGKTIRDYSLQEWIGQGAMGAVYKAVHTRLQKTVAIKLINEKIGGDDLVVSRFHREMKAVGHLNHPQFVNALDAGEEDGVSFLVMEYVAGIDLAALTANGQSLELSAACEIIRQAAIGLQYAHSNGVVHRDVKPSNLMLSLDDQNHCRVKILDLGLAWVEGLSDELHLTDQGQLMGTLEYMAPEQAEETHGVDFRADIYALGATFFRLTTGATPFETAGFNTPARRLKALLSLPTPSVAAKGHSLPVELVGLIDSMLSKNPLDRPESMSEVADRLATFCDKNRLETQFSERLAQQETQRKQESIADALVDTTPSLGETLDVSPDQVIDEQPHYTGTRNSSRWRRIFAVIGLLTVILLSVLWLRTDGGYIRIQTTDPTIQVNVEVFKAGKVIEELHTGTDDKQFWFRSGRYEVRLPVDAQESLKLVNGNVSIERNGQAVVTISRVEDASSEQAEKSSPSLHSENDPGNVVPIRSNEILVTTHLDARKPIPGSLREAINTAQNGDVIRFASSLSGRTIVLAGEPLEITKSLKIDARELPEMLIISGNNYSRVFSMQERREIELCGLRIVEGKENSVGGGLSVKEANVRLQQCEISDCWSLMNGGGVYCQDGFVLLESCLIANCTAEQLGGGLANFGGSCLLKNCTLTKNQSGREHGGAMTNVNYGKMELIHCTVSGNMGSGISSHYSARLIIESSIVTENDNVDDGMDRSIWVQKIEGGGIVTRGSNIFDKLGAEVKSGPDPIGDKAKLAPLGDYGGPIRTIPPLQGSIAIDAAIATQQTPAKDARGLVRPIDGNGDGNSIADIGAVEFHPEIDVISAKPTSHTFDHIQFAEWVIAHSGDLIYQNHPRVVRNVQDIPLEPLPILSVELRVATDDDIRQLLAWLPHLKDCRSILANGGHQSGFTDAAIPILSQMKQLQSLHINSRNITDDGIRKLIGLSNLRDFALSGTQVRGKGLEWIQETFPQLSRLAIYSRVITGEDLESLTKFKKLNNIELNLPTATAETLNSVSRTTATVLTLREMPVMNTEIAKNFAKMENLENLSLLNCIQFDDDHLAALVDSKTLRDLKITQGTKLTPNGILAALKLNTTMKIHIGVPLSNNENLQNHTRITCLPNE